MRVASIIDQYLPGLQHGYASQLLPSHLKAIAAIQRCRTPEAGEILLHCGHCRQLRRQPKSCGHRFCPQCQNHDTSRWLERQQRKLLPVRYFMLTFTLPRQLRTLAWSQQRLMYTLMFAVISSTLKDFGLNPENNLGANIGMTAVLHTHSRRLDYHPHIHVIVPGGGVNLKRMQWKKIQGKYLFNSFALASVFRARMLAAIKAEKLRISDAVPKKWVVHCKDVGQGQPALKYLSRYLYRGVISEKNIVNNRDGKVTFRYIDSKTGETKYRTLPGEQFLWLLLQHVLPKGLRRVRDYGFLHGRAKRLLARVQLLLRVMIEAAVPRPRPAFKCPHCQAPMQIVGFITHRLPSG
jgi:hypothetical protein